MITEIDTNVSQNCMRAKEALTHVFNRLEPKNTRLLSTRADNRGGTYICEEAYCRNELYRN